MKTKNKEDRASLVLTAKKIAEQLRTQRVGTRLRLRKPGELSTESTDTDGWCVVIGTLGRGQPRLEVWLDRISGHVDRKFYAGFFSGGQEKIDRLCRKVSRHFPPVRKLTQADITGTKVHRFKEELRAGEFGQTVLEHYPSLRGHFFGFFNRSPVAGSKSDRQFSERAIAFFLDVALSFSGTEDRDAQGDAYPRCENRKWVKAHLSRERSGHLAAERKERDQYRCQVCAKTFAEMYGEELGAHYAEAHHLNPLGKQRNKVRTTVDDLITVCANCHRMLHRMEGKPDDVKKLRAIFRRLEAKRS